MKLKYYLRGLGIGMIVTALLMGVSGDRQVSAKGTAGGETEPAVAYSTEEEEPVSSQAQEESTKEEETEQNMELESEPVTESEIENITEDAQAETEEQTEPESMETETEMETVTVTQAEPAEELPKEVQELLEKTRNASSYTLEIVRGDDSGTVARKLYNAGLVENAAEFDAFLMQHGYDKKISIGTVVIPKDASWVEIAEKLAGK